MSKFTHLDDLPFLREVPEGGRVQSVNLATYSESCVTVG